MHLAFWIAVFGTTLVIGIVIGFNTALYVKEQESREQAITASGIAITIASSVGAIIGAFGLIQVWNKDRQIPSLEFSGFIARDYYTIQEGERAGWIAMTYLLRIRKSKGVGKAEACEGQLIIKEPSGVFPCRWSPDSVKYCDIGGTMELVLFYAIPRVGNYEEIIIPAISMQDRIEMIGIPYNDFTRSRAVTIEVFSKNAKTPKALEKTIGEIIDETNRPS